MKTIWRWQCTKSMNQSNQRKQEAWQFAQIRESVRQGFHQSNKLKAAYLCWVPPMSSQFGAQGSHFTTSVAPYIFRSPHLRIYYGKVGFQDDLILGTQYPYFL